MSYNERVALPSDKWLTIVRLINKRLSELPRHSEERMELRAAGNDPRRHETTMATKHIRFDVERGERRWQAHFAGRPGCERILVTQEMYDRDGNTAPGLYIDMPVPVAEAWDRAIRAAKAIPRSVPSAEANRRAAEIIERELDAVAPREEVAS